MSFTRNLFNGTPVPQRRQVPNVTWMEVVWDCDVSRIGKEEREMTGKDKMCSVRDLEPDTEYAIYLMCCGE